MFYPKFALVLKHIPVVRLQSLRAVADTRQYFKLAGAQHQSRPQLQPLSSISQDYKRNIYHNHSRHHHHRHRHHDREKGEENWFREPRLTYGALPLLGLLGLSGFRNLDSEKQRLELTDEEKMKKMSPAELMIAKGVLAMLDQEYTKAEILFHQALEVSQSDANHQQELLILNLLASNYFESGQLVPAEKLFIDIMKRMMAQGAEPTDLAILELSLKLASIYSENPNTRDKATRGFKFVIDSLKVRLQSLLNDAGELVEDCELGDEKRDELALLGWSYDWFAKHLITSRDHWAAVNFLKKALNISSKVLGPLHDQTLILLNDVGTAMAMNDEPEKGERFLQQAVEGAIKSRSKELASFYVNLGLVNLKLNKLDEAKRYCEYSTELASKNPDHHNSGEVIQLSATCLKEVKRLSAMESK